ncbi:MAG: anhydro-N-acetylmuramic acid kinase [Pseudomonadota bacterium]
MTKQFVGLMSGTSMDGIDAVLVSFAEHAITVHSTLSHPYPDALRDALLTEIRKPLDEAIDPDGALDQAVAESFSQAALQLIAAADVEIACIGSHGQTLRHCPDADPPFTIQVGDPSVIARATGVPTVGDFRRADIDAGGQGAPLVPPFHEWLFHSPDQDRIVVNIGGIANVTVLPRTGDVTGFDTGPGNGLMDVWIRRHRDTRYDAGGEWGATGSVDEELLQRMLGDPYFAAAAPKSTGFEYFNLAWIDRLVDSASAPADVQATLCELTARSIAAAVVATGLNVFELFVCGGGAHNGALMKRLARNLPETKIASTAAVGLHPDWVEACAFAWLARETQNDRPGNMPTVTGANKRVVLGELHSP